jgi:hypothetical protein
MSPAPALAHQSATHRLHVLLEQAADTAHAPELVFEAGDIVVPDGLLIPYLAVADAGIELEGRSSRPNPTASAPARSRCPAKDSVLWFQPRTGPENRNGDSLRCRRAPVRPLPGAAVLLAVRDAVWIWAVSGAAAVGTVIMHSLAADFRRADLLRDTLGNSFTGAAAAMTCAVPAAVLAGSAPMHRRPSTSATTANAPDRKAPGGKSGRTAEGPAHDVFRSRAGPSVTPVCQLP